jgi:hypothetical protein
MNSSIGFHKRIGRLLLLAGILSSAPILAQDLISEKVGPSTNAFPLTSIPAIDGNVFDDAAWANVAPASGFTQVQPYEGQPATQRTEVFIGFSEESLYIGVIAYDDNPEQIIVSDSRRDSNIDETDSFQVIIDGFFDRQSGYVFGTNPVGIEYDGQVINEGSAAAVLT